MTAKLTIRTGLFILHVLMNAQLIIDCVPAGRSIHTGINRISKTCPASVFALIFIVLVTPPGGVTPLLFSAARHASKVFPAPAPAEFRFGNALRFIGVDPAGYLLIGTTDSKSGVYRYARNQEKHHRQYDYQGCSFHDSSSFLVFTGMASFRHKGDRSFWRPANQKSANQIFRMQLQGRLIPLNYNA